MIKRLLAPVFALGYMVLPILAHAQAQGTIGGSTTVKEPLFNTVDDVVAKACTVVNWLFTGALILTVIFVLLAAIKYITKGSDPGEVATAHQMLIWAAIGFAVALLAAVAPEFIAGVVGVKDLSSAC